jgi:glutathione peroxidase
VSVYTFEAKTINGELQPLSAYKGSVLLIVNTAGKCGYAVQFEGLQKLYETYRSQGFVVLGFPSNQFLQEPDDEAGIAQSCRIDHGVTFPMFAKVDVNGAHAHPLFRYLTQHAPGFLGTKSVKWNFTKFLVDREGRPVKRFAPADTPEQIEADIRELVESP